MARTAFSWVVNCSQTERGARKDTSMLAGISFVITRDDSCPMISSGTLRGGRVSSGSAAVTADIQTAKPRTSARRKERRFIASQRMLFLFAEEIGEEALKPYALWCGRIGSEECCKDIFEAFRVNVADHAARVRDGYGTALFGNDDGYRVTDFGNAKSGAMTKSQLPLRRTVEDPACGEGHYAGCSDDTLICDDDCAIMQRGIGIEDLQK